jgi:hypothetical protein
MKSMLSLLMLFQLLPLVQAQGQDEMSRITAMRSIVESGDLRSFVDQAKRNGWTAPHIPSQWHVENASSPNRKSIELAARGLGKAFAKQFADIAPSMQTMVADERLSAVTLMLLDLSDWCATTEGYGNVLLAQRCLDLAAVGVARLTANLDFPVERCQALLVRTNPSWMSATMAVRVLNKDAGAEVFTTTDRAEMERIYASGQRLLAEQRNPQLLAERQRNPRGLRLIETPAIKANLSFFDGVEIGQVKPLTLINLWDKSWHLRIINGLELQSIQKAKGLAEFRRLIGKFPDKSFFSSEQLQKIEQWSREFSEKNKITRVVTSVGVFDSLEKAAFAHAWSTYLEKTYGYQAKAPSELHNLDARAFQAYDEVQRGVFFDQDTANARQYEELSKAAKANP